MFPYDNGTQDPLGQRWQRFMQFIQQYRARQEQERAQGLQFLQGLQQRFGGGGGGAQLPGGGFGGQQPAQPQGQGEAFTGFNGLQALQRLFGGGQAGNGGLPGAGVPGGPDRFRLDQPTAGGGQGGQAQVGPNPRATILPPGQFSAFV